MYAPEYGVITPEPAADWRTGISYRDGDLSLWCVEVGQAARFGAAAEMRPVLHQQEEHAGLLGYVRRGVRCGPMRVARTNTTDEKEKAKIEKALENMGAAFWALLPDGTDVEIKESSRGDALQRV